VSDTLCLLRVAQTAAELSKSPCPKIRIPLPPALQSGSKYFVYHSNRDHHSPTCSRKLQVSILLSEFNSIDSIPHLLTKNQHITDHPSHLSISITYLWHKFSHWLHHSPTARFKPKVPARQSQGSVDADSLLVAMIEDPMGGPVAVSLGVQALCFAGLLHGAEQLGRRVT